MDEKQLFELDNLLDELSDIPQEWKRLEDIDSPLINEYVGFKQQKPTHILFFQVGDFYELYEDDAKKASDRLNLKLTQREIKGVTIPMCGFPSNSGINFANQLAKEGEKVILISQKKDENEKIVRFIDKTVTPSTISDDEYLSKDEHQYIMTCYEMKNEMGITVFDTMSGETLTRTETKYALLDLISKFQPKEVKIYLTREWETEFLQKFKVYPQVELYKLPFFFEEMKSIIDAHKETYFNHSFAPYSIIASHYFMIQYVEKTQGQHVTMRPIHYLQNREYLYLHKTAISGLDLLENSQTRKKDKSLFALLDQCKTAKGSRLLKKWIQEPLIDEKEIKNRHFMVEYFIKNAFLREDLQNILSQTTDLERTIARFETQKFKDFELVGMLDTLMTIQMFLQTIIEKATFEPLVKTSKKRLEKLKVLIENYQTKISRDGVVAKNYNEKFDQMRDAKENGLSIMERYFEEEKENTGIKTMKLEENKVLGYHFEVTKSQYDKIPDYFVVRKELSNKKQCVTEKLKELEENYLDAVENYDFLYRNMIRQILLEIAGDYSFIRNTLDFVSYLDVLLSFTEVAEKYHYQKPIISESDEISFQDGVHPLLQAFSYRKVVPNSCRLKEKEIHLITGPNMGGKTVYQKLTALLVIMAQIGSFVPAKLLFKPVDRILLRMGANDSLIENQSTFMVEMEEVAYIVHHATKNSLIIMDELGRGTSTSDGISIADSVIHYIHENIQAKTLCSTHYHELIELEKELKNIRNFHVEVIETEKELTLTYKVRPGGSSKSFGIEAAKRVGLPSEIVEKAKKLLETKYEQ